MFSFHTCGFSRKLQTLYPQIVISKNSGVGGKGENISGGYCITRAQTKSQF